MAVTFPGAIGNDRPSWIAGGCLRNFLRLGCWVRHNVPPDLISGAVAGDAESVAHLDSDEFPEWVGPGGKKQLKGLAKRFGLKPLGSVADHVVEWQRSYLPLERNPGAAAG